MSKVRLGDYVRIKTGKLDANAASPDGDYPFFTCAVEPLKIDSYSYDCECVLVAGNGDLNVKYYDGKFDAYQRTYIIESKDNTRLSVPYLYRFLDAYIDTLRNQSIGGVIKYIKLGNLTEARINVPAISEQNKTVKILSFVDELLKKANLQLQKLDELIKSRFVEIFGDTFINPYNWQSLKIQEAVEVEPQNGLYKPQSDYVEDKSGVPILRIDGFYNGKVVDFQKLKRLMCTKEEFDKYRLIENDIVINRVNSLEYLGKCACISGLIEGTVFESNMMRMHFYDERFNPIYITFLLCSKYTYNQIIKHAKKAVNQASINQKDVLDINIYEPPIDLQNQFGDFVSKAEQQKSTVQKSIDKLETLKKSLMQEYFG